MKKRTLLAVIGISAVGWSQSCDCDPIWRQVGDRLVVSGTKYYGLQMLSVTGNKDMYNDDNYGYSSRYRNETNLTFTGYLVSNLSVTATMSNNRWNPNSRTMSLNYDGKHTKAAIGDINAGLTGNELISFSKRLRGATVTQSFGNLSLTAMASQTKAATKTVKISGNNTPGPYYLGVSLVVDGSERVKIDEKEITRADASGNINYTFDSFSGILTFRDGMIVPSTSEITVSFETQSYNSTSGTIWGMRADLTPNKKASVGLTMLGQRSQRSSSSLKEITEPFRGNGSLSQPYELLYVPMNNSLIIKVDGVLQTSPLDYTVNYALKYILFNRIIAPSSTVLVAYVPKPENDVQGDRNVIGLDSKYKVNDNLSFAANLARSSSDYSGLNSGGTAASLRADASIGKLKMIANLRDIDKRFAPLESAGFFRNERGGSLDFRYAVSNALNWFAKVERFKRPDYRTSDPTTAPMLTATQTSAGVQWKPGERSHLSLSRTDTVTNGVRGASDKLTSDSLQMDWTRGYITTTGELSKATRVTNYINSTTHALTTTQNESNTARVSLRYSPNERFNVIGDVADSSVKTLGGSSTNAGNYGISATILPRKDLSLGLVYRVTDSGGNYNTPYSNTGTGTGSGWEYGYVQSYGYKSINRMVNLAWNPSSKMSFDTSYNFSLADGENSTNTSIAGYDFGFALTPMEILSLRGHLSTQDGSFVGATGSMSSRIGFLSLSAGPIRKFDLEMNYQNMTSGTLYAASEGDPLQNSDVTLRTLSGILRRDVGKGRYLFGEYSTSLTGGISANSKNIFALGVEYPLTQVLGLKVDWRLINYKDSNNSSFNYRANMLNAQIGARFR